MGAIHSRKPQEIAYNYPLIEGERYLIVPNKRAITDLLHENLQSVRLDPVLGMFHKLEETTTAMTSDNNYSIKRTYEFYNIFSFREMIGHIKRMGVSLDKGIQIWLDEHEKTANEKKYDLMPFSNFSLYSIPSDLVLGHHRLYNIYRLQYDKMKYREKQRSLKEGQKLLDTILDQHVDPQQNLSRKLIHLETEDSTNPNLELIEYSPELKTTNIKELKNSIKPFDVQELFRKLAKESNYKYTLGGKKSKKSKRGKKSKKSKSQKRSV
tara:strand:+ start:8780 stop:9580 length:801 start_codon:yes stop_codon:yes gene_type:complete